MFKKLAGVDVGISGAVAILENKHIKVYDIGMVSKIKNAIVFIEVPIYGIRSRNVHRLHRLYARVSSLLENRNFVVHLNPHEWQSILGVKGKENIKKFVMDRFNLDDGLRQDYYDAVAILEAGRIILQKSMEFIEKCKREQK